MSFFFLSAFLAFVIFVRIYGPALLTEFLADWEAKQAARFETASTTPAPLTWHERHLADAQLLGAFGLAGDHGLDDWTPYEWLDVEELDSELELLLCDDSLTTDQALTAIDEMLRRERAART
jgi:hypothetical protein